MRNFKRQAFSLIELSIVILIIGILVAGVTQSSRLVRAIKLQSARSITLSSPVNSINNLIAWYETTSEKAIDENEKQNNTEISRWFDINATSTLKNDAVQNNFVNRAKYIENAINGLPVVRFDGVDDFFDFNGQILVGTNYTIFIVEQRRTNNDTWFFGGTSFGYNMCLHLGYFNGGTSIRHGHFAEDYDCANCFATYTTPIPRIHIFRFSMTEGKRYYLNSTSIASQNASQRNPLVSFNSAYIGKFGSGNLNADIGEIIIFVSALNTEEMQSIIQYLGKKWAIKIN